MEKKNKETKTALTYEQLNDACMQLYQQNQELMKRLQQVDTASMFKRLDYLFEVVKNSSAFNSDFVVTCVEEIQEAMTIPPVETGENTNGKE